MNITNGMVSRTFKPADYEGRTVTLAFVLDDGEDVDVAVAKVAQMCERHARLSPPSAVTQAVVTAERPRAVKPPVAEEVRQENPPVDVETSTEPSVVITDDALLKACQRTTARLQNPDRTKAVIAQFIEKAGMSVRTIVQEKRAVFIQALDALKADNV